MAAVAPTKRQILDDLSQQTEHFGNFTQAAQNLNVALQNNSITALITIDFQEIRGVFSDRIAAGFPTLGKSDKIDSPEYKKVYLQLQERISAIGKDDKDADEAQSEIKDFVAKFFLPASAPSPAEQQSADEAKRAELRMMEDLAKPSNATDNTQKARKPDKRPPQPSRFGRTFSIIAGLLTIGAVLAGLAFLVRWVRRSK